MNTIRGAGQTLVLPKEASRLRKFVFKFFELQYTQFLTRTFVLLKAWQQRRGGLGERKSRYFLLFYW